MPIAPRFHVEHVRDLAMQLTRASTTNRKLQIESAEQLIKEIEEETLYPLDYIVYRITGYRGDSVKQPMILGSALLGDLVSLIAIVSRTLELSATNMMTVKQGATYLGVSSRTLSRLRHEGLVFHWVAEVNGRFRLGCSSAMLDDFVNRNKDRIQKASRFSRLTSKEKQEIIDLAMQFDGKHRTLSEVASTLSRQSNRGHETIRLLLQKTESVTRTFPQPKTLSRKDARKIERELQRGVSLLAIATQYQRSAGAIRKSLARLRSTRLKQMEISFVELDVFSRPDAVEVILGSPIARRTNPPQLILDSLEFNLEDSDLGNEETAIVSAMHLLRRRANLKSKLLGYAPSERDLDRIETDLRWSFLLQQMLIILAMPSSLAVAVQHVGRPLHELPSNRLISLVHHLIQVVGETCAELNPLKGQTAGRTPASVLDRNLSVVDSHSKPLQAAAKYKAIELECPFHQIVPWFHLIPRKNLPELANQTSSELKNIVSMRFGWKGNPKTIQEIAEEIGKSPIWVTKQLRRWS